jgi:glycosyltransferase involved in cell wall biosynthesis
MNHVPVTVSGRPSVVFLNNQGLASIGGGVTILRHLVAGLAADCRLTVLSHDPPASGVDFVRQVTVPPPPPMGALWRLAPLVRARHLARVVPAAELAAADLVVALDCHFAPLLGRTRPRRLIYLSLSCIPRQEWFAAYGGQALLRFAQYMHLERRVIRIADVVVVSSATHAAELRRFELLPGLDPVVLPPVFRGERFARRTERAGPVTILSAGRLDTVKNYAAVIEMAARLRDLPCRFVIAGDGPDAATLRQRAVAAGIADRVEFTGPVADVGTLLAEADLFLHPSRYESFGIAVFEAMRAGVPPICASRAVAGYREITHDGVDSCFVDFDRPDAAAAAIRALVTDPARRATMSAAARDAAERVSAWDYTAAFRGIVHRLLGEAVTA